MGVKFKVGDKVRCIEGTQDGVRLVKGRDYTVTGHYLAVGVKVDGRDSWWYPERFELVETARPVAEKPPLGLRPQSVATALRIQEILEAMHRYSQASKEVPEEWSIELYMHQAWQREQAAKKTTMHVPV